MKIQSFLAIAIVILFLAFGCNLTKDVPTVSLGTKDGTYYGGFFPGPRLVKSIIPINGGWVIAIPLRDFKSPADAYFNMYTTYNGESCAMFLTKDAAIVEKMSRDFDLKKIKTYEGEKFPPDSIYWVGGPLIPVMNLKEWDKDMKATISEAGFNAFTEYKWCTLNAVRALPVDADKERMEKFLSDLRNDPEMNKLIGAWLAQKRGQPQGDQKKENKNDSPTINWDKLAE